MTEKERAYRAMKGAGTAGLTLGIIALAVGLAVGVLSIISGARLLKAKNGVMI